MKQLLSAAGRAFLRAFVSGIVVYGAGVLAAPNLNRMYLLGVAALSASLAAGFRAIAGYVPQLSFVRWLGHPVGDWTDAFAHAFLGSLLVTLTGWLGAPDLHTVRAAATAAVYGAINAGVRALQGTLTRGERPAPPVGIAPPPATG